MRYTIQTWSCPVCGFSSSRIHTSSRDWCKLSEMPEVINCFKNKHHYELKEKTEHLDCPEGCVLVWDDKEVNDECNDEC